MTVWRLGLVAAAALALCARTAAANTFDVNCLTGMVSGAASATFTPTTVLGAVLGTPTSLATVSPAPAPGDTVAITGICVEDVTMTVSGLTVTNHNGLNSGFTSSDGVEGQLEIAGATGTVIDGLLLGGLPSFTSSTDVALLSAHDGASLLLSNATVENSPLLGALAQRASKIEFRTVTVSGNGGGASDTTPMDNGGIEARDTSTIILGMSNGSDAVTISNHTFDAVAAYRDSAVVIYSAQFTGNTDHQIVAMGASSAYITLVVNGVLPTTSIVAPSGAKNALLAVGTSTLRIDNGVSITAASGTEAIQVEGGSAVLVQGAFVAAAGAGPVIEANSGSVIALAGGNNICNGTLSGATCTPGTGLALEIDHVASLVQVTPADFGYTAATDTITGQGQAVLQSTVDLGLGLVSSSPSLNWTTGTNGISIAQNSSFRLQGGATITGKVKISQGSNGFFNLTKGGTNSITAGVLCPFTSLPAAHVVAGTSGSPTVTPFPNPSTNFQSTTANQCLSF